MCSIRRAAVRRRGCASRSKRTARSSRTRSPTEQAEDADADVTKELGRLNELYERRFGFRFVVWVNGRTKAAIATVLRERLTRDREPELAAGVEEFLAIAADRLRARP